VVAVVDVAVSMAEHAAVSLIRYIALYIEKAYLMDRPVEIIRGCHGCAAIIFHSFGQVEPAHKKERASDSYADTSPEDRLLLGLDRQEARFVGRPVSGKIYRYRRLRSHWEQLVITAPFSDLRVPHD
jgi:hypothetical protein